MGGVAIQSRERPVKPLYELNIDREVEPSEYDGLIGNRLSGVTNGHAKLLTRHHNWARCSALEAG